MDALLNAQMAKRPFAHSPLTPSGTKANADAVLLPPAIPWSGLSLATSMAGPPKRFGSIAGSSSVDSARFSASAADVYNRSDNSSFSCHAGASGVMSFEVLVSPESFNALGGYIVSKFTVSGSVWEFTLFHDGSGIPNILFGNAGSTVMTVAAPSAMVVNRRYHLAVEYDRAAPRVTLFVNGKGTSSTSATGNTADTSAVLRIGLRSDSTRPFHGRISHLAFYNRILGRAVWETHAGIAFNPPATRPL